MDDDGAVTLFVAIVRAGSITGAAQRLGLAKSSVSRQLTQLEYSLGVRLINRTTRSLELTQTGQRYFDRVSAAVDVIADARTAMKNATVEASGVVRLFAPPDVGTELLPQVIADFLATRPRVSVQVELRSGFPSLAVDMFDLAIVGGVLPDSSLVSLRVQDMAFRLYATAGYLFGRPPIVDLSDLVQHRAIFLGSASGPAKWRLRGPGGDETVEVPLGVAANDLGFIRRMVSSGAGVALLPEAMGLPLVNSGQLTAVLPDYSWKGAPLYVVHPTRHLQTRATSELRMALLAWFKSFDGRSGAPSAGPSKS